MASSVRRLLIAGLLLGWLSDYSQTECRAEDSEDSDGKIRYRLFECPEGYFRCEIPSDWQRIREEREEARTHYHGVYLFPGREKEPRPTLSIRYFAPDNAYFANADKYLDRQFKSGLRLAGEKLSPVRETSVDGRPARAFTRDAFVFYPPESIDTTKFPVRHEHVVIPHRTGFVLVNFTSPTEAYDRWRPTFDRLLKTLELQPRSDTLEVRVILPGLPSEATESKGLQPLEVMVKKAADSLSIRSACRTGEGVVWADLKPGAGIRGIQAAIELELKSSPLPPDATVTCAPRLDDLMMRIALWAQDSLRSPTEVGGEVAALARRILLERLRGVAGVARVDFAPAIQDQIHVIPAFNRLVAAGIDVTELQQALAGLSHKQGSARAGLDDVQQAVCATRDGKDVRVVDVATVRMGQSGGSANLLWLPGMDGGEPRHPPAVVLTVRTWETADPAAVFRSVSRLLDELTPNLPPGIQFEQHAGTAADLWITPADPPRGEDSSDANPRSMETTAGKIARVRGVQSVWLSDSDPAFLPRSMSFGRELFVAIEPAAMQRRAEIHQEAAGLTGESAAVRDASAPFTKRGMFPGVSGGTSLTVSGPDLQVVSGIADDLARRVRRIATAGRVQVVPAVVETTLEFKIEDDRAARFGVVPGEVRNVLKLFTEAQPLGTVVLAGGRQAEIILKLDADDRDALVALKDLPFRTRDGICVRLAEIAVAEWVYRPASLYRDNGRRAMLVSFDAPVSDRARSDSELQSIIAALELPPGYTVTANEGQPR